ncbi:hypothetical protein [Hyphomicrobium sp. CS1GBMeth3]|uniref:hypothetical protein n=1 Tax=Hyphomicrobium sp. CS1GBMeth3 TaxID=1892845 RepID=UPI000A4F13AF|nr:hypothetical protein [Hyphomicrobium sp. CS1GBMeth3]
MTTASHGSLKALALGISTAACAFGLGSATASAADWSTTEVQFQYGKLDSPFAGGTAWTPIITLQHASGYSFGDVFFFVDFIDDDTTDGFNDKDAYGEFYAYFSSAKILGATYGGPIKDVGVVLGLNYGADADYLSYLPGAYIDWKAPGFAFLRTQVTAVIDDSGPYVTQGDGWQFDISWGLPFQIGGQYFSFEGHAEYTGTQDEDWILAQPQLRWDAGYAFTGKKDVFFLGTEYQYWRNKLGTDVDESAFQALAVWRF